MFEKFKERQRLKKIRDEVPRVALALIEQFLTDTNYAEKYLSAKYFQKHVEIARPELTKSIMENVLEIVKSDKPTIEMRRKLIFATRMEVMNRLVLMDDEFSNKKQLIFDHMNKEKMQDDPWTEDKCFQVMVYNEAEIIILRLLQVGYFEDVPKNDWWEAYVPAVETKYKYLYKAIIGQAENREGLNPVEQELFKVYGMSLPSIEKQLLGEIPPEEEK